MCGDPARAPARTHLPCGPRGGTRLPEAPSWPAPRPGGGAPLPPNSAMLSEALRPACALRTSVHLVRAGAPQRNPVVPVTPVPCGHCDCRRCWAPPRPAGGTPGLLVHTTWPAQLSCRPRGAWSPGCSPGERPSEHPNPSPTVRIPSHVYLVQKCIRQITVPGGETELRAGPPLLVAMLGSRAQPNVAGRMEADKPGPAGAEDAAHGGDSPVMHGAVNEKEHRPGRAAEGQRGAQGGDARRGQGGREREHRPGWAAEGQWGAQGRPPSRRLCSQSPRGVSAPPSGCRVQTRAPQGPPPVPSCSTRPKGPLGVGSPLGHPLLFAYL